MELYLDKINDVNTLEAFRDLQRELINKPLVDGTFALLEIDASNVAPSDSLTSGGSGSLDNLNLSGYSLHYNQSVNLTGLLNILNFAFQMGYKAPTVTFTANGSNTTYEKGQNVNVNNLTTNVVKESNSIASVKFFNGATEIYDVPSVNTESNSYSYNPSLTINNTTTFSTKVTDAIENSTGGTEVTKSVTYNFVYPYYTGWDSAGLTAAQVALLSKLVIPSTASRKEDYVTTVTAKVFYFAYPKVYGALSSILDKNGYEVLGDFTLRDEPITGLDGTPQNYYIYEFKNLVVPNSYSFTYKR